MSSFSVFSENFSGYISDTNHCEMYYSSVKYRGKVSQMIRFALLDCSDV